MVQLHAPGWLGQARVQSQEAETSGFGGNQPLPQSCAEVGYILTQKAASKVI